MCFQENENMNTKKQGSLGFPMNRGNKLAS